MLTETQATELRVAFNTWRLTEKLEGRPYPDKTDDVFKCIAVRALNFGAPEARSAWTRAARELSDEGVIRLRKPMVVPTPIPADFEAQISAMSSTQLREKLNRDPAFASIYGRWAAAERPEGAIAAEPELTAIQYRSLPAAAIARKYAASADFRRQVQKLIDAGQI